MRRLRLCVRMSVSENVNERGGGEAGCLGSCRCAVGALRALRIFAQVECAGLQVECAGLQAKRMALRAKRATCFNETEMNDQNKTVFADDRVGLGVDIVEIERMRRIIARTPSFVEKTFSEAERAYCDAKAAPEVHYATRFAAKEAVLKALGTGFAEGIWVRDVEVRRTSKGRPYVVLSGRAREIARERGVREIPLSLSYTHSEAVACAMAITEGAVDAAKKRVDPMEELAQQFKEARAMLDELPVNGVTAGEAE